MPRIFITGSADGLGLISARQLIAQGHTVFLHARTPEKAAALAATLPDAAGIATADISTLRGMRSLADQANAFGRMDGVIHNAGVMSNQTRNPSADGWPTTLAVNTVAPYVLTALMHRPDRLAYLSSSMHRQGNPDLSDLLWTRRKWSLTQAYSDTKLHDLMLALAIADRWPDVRSNAVTPGWVATRMGGAGAPDDAEAGADTQSWLAAGTDPASDMTGQYLFHRKVTAHHPAADDPAARTALLDALADLTGITLP
jgi:NAD(P)-dependent dehydrogenase (short-subunit alcohol dehydrogenase family)